MEVSHTPVDIPTPRDAWTALNDLPQRVNSLAQEVRIVERGRIRRLRTRTPRAVRPNRVCGHRRGARPARCGPAVRVHRRRDASPGLSLCPDLSHRRWSGVGARTLYRARRGERAVAALERKVGIVEGYWTPLAARHGAMLVSHLTPRDAEEVLATLGHMQPSKRAASTDCPKRCRRDGRRSVRRSRRRCARRRSKCRTRPARWWSRSTG